MSFKQGFRIFGLTNSSSTQSKISLCNFSGTSVEFSNLRQCFLSIKAQISPELLILLSNYGNIQFGVVIIIIMPFVIKRLLHLGKKHTQEEQRHVSAQPVFDGSQITFKYNGQDLKIKNMETLMIDLCLELVQLPLNSALQITPHQDQIKTGSHGPLKMFHHKRDVGKRLISSLTHFDKKDKKIKHGDNLFKGILKSVIDDPFQLLALA